MRVRNLMTPSPITVAPDDSIGTALGRMLRHDIHELPVMEDEKLVGIMTERDLRMALGPGVQELDVETMNGDGMEDDVASVMAEDVTTISTEDTVAEACRTVANLRVGSLPVVDSHGRLRGILSVTDLLIAAAELFDTAQ